MAAIAGRVMPITKGQYNSETTYEPLDFVTYNNALWGCIKSVKGIAPTEGQYWKKLIDGVVSDAASLGGETATQWQTKIDNIQTTSRATLSGAGWYRVAEFVTTRSVVLNGVAVDTCELTIKGLYQTGGHVFQNIRYTALYKSPRVFEVIKSAYYSKQTVTKIRHTYSETDNKMWLEIYYNHNGGNLHTFVINGSPNVYSEYWKAITPTLTEETVDGVTVTTTYDIPANASPVTDLDLVRANGTEMLKTSVLEKALTLPVGAHEFLLGGANYTGGDLPHSLYQYGMASVFVWGGIGGNIVVELHGHKNTGSYRPATKYYADGSGWSDWFIGVNTADLANYFKNTGGEINGDVRQTITTASTISRVLQNQKKKIHEYISSDGTYVLADATNGKNISVNAPDGTNTWYGTASGNLPLDGGGTVKAASSVPVLLDNISSGATGCYIGFKTEGVTQGSVGTLNGELVCVPKGQSSAKKLLHEGNYTDYNEFSKGISLTNANADEGGEIRFASPVTDHSFGGMITQDIWRNMMRIFATHDGKTKLFNIDFASMKEGGNEALHTGNSAKVSISATAPSDTNTLWVDTANKKVKAYIDGAWTAMA